MSITLTWDNVSKSALRYVHYGYWTWDDLNRAVDEAQYKFRHHRHTVHVIVDLRESAGLPEWPMIREKNRHVPGHGKDSQIILVGSASLTWPYLDIMRKLFRSRRSSEHIHYVETLEDARRLVQTFDRKPAVR